MAPLFCLSDQAAAVPTKNVSVFHPRKEYLNLQAADLKKKKTVMSSDRSKQLILDLALALPLAGLGRLLRLRLRLALAHDRVLPREGVRGRGVRFVVQPPLDVECHVDR